MSEADTRWVVYEPVNRGVAARCARPFKDVTGGKCFEWRYVGQPDRGGWATYTTWRQWVRRSGAKVTSEALSSSTAS